MRIDQITDVLSKEHGLTKKDAKEVYNTLVELVYSEANAEPETKVTLPGLGSFKVKEKEAYKSKNPRTGEEVDVDASRRVSFSAAKAFKDKLNGK
jgi:DNA-binding protein HU-beta